MIMIVIMLMVVAAGNAVAFAVGSAFFAGIVVIDSRFNSFFRKNGAMKLCGGKTFQSFHNGGVGQFESFVNALALDKFRCHAAGCNSRTAAESLEANVLNNAVIVDFQEHLHDIAALRGCAK